jgi:hypothetical protein
VDLVHSSWCVSLLQEANSETKNKEYKQIVFPVFRIGLAPSNLNEEKEKMSSLVKFVTFAKHISYGGIRLL